MSQEESRRIEVGIGVIMRQCETERDHPAGTGQGWEVLIARRRAGTVYAGYWEFPGGKVEAGETIEACVVREIREELGLTVTVDEKLLVVEHDYPHGQVRLHVMRCRWVAGKAENHEVAEHRWVPIGLLGEYRFPEANDVILEQIRQYES